MINKYEIRVIFANLNVYIDSLSLSGSSQLSRKHLWKILRRDQRNEMRSSKLLMFYVYTGFSWRRADIADADFAINI